jgi:polyvinyl alcohol dehydrogenase (cytochrome)
MRTIVITAAGTALFAAAAGALAILPGGGQRSALAQAPHPVLVADTTGERIFQARCASCHTAEGTIAPTRELIASRSAEMIVATLTSGSMRQMATGLTGEEIRSIAAYLTGTAPTDVVGRTGTPTFCSAPGRIDLARGWNGWGLDLANSRYQTAGGLRAEDVSRLRVKWTFAYPEGLVFTQPTVVGDRVFVGSMPGLVHALDLETGCTHWTYDPGAEGVRAAILIGDTPGAPGRHTAYVADGGSVVHALDAERGTLLWKTEVEDHPVSRITGSPVLHDGRLYVTVSSDEERAATNEQYECCTFRGSVVALDPADGRIVWQSYLIEEEPKPYAMSRVGTTRFGPAGAAVWMSPTIDPRRGLLYVGTGNEYTDVPDTGSSAILALELETGKIRWSNQITANDAFVVGCGAQRSHANCPEEVGPDWDFGASPILRTLPDGREVLFVGQKSGVLYVVNPDDGSIIRETRLGGGSPLGGIQWGMAADANRLYVAVSDPLTPPAERRPGITAIRISDGEKLWHAPSPAPACSWTGGRGCINGQSAALTLIPGLVLSGSLDGHLRAYSTSDGSLVWSFDTAAETYATVNGFTVRGGSMDATGATVANGHVLVNSGYTRYGVGFPGNLLLVLSLDGR